MALSKKVDAIVEITFYFVNFVIKISLILIVPFRILNLSEKILIF
jgi:hypothetical protein